MLYIIANKNQIDEKSFSWHVGNKPTIQSTDLLDVDYLEVSGHELDFLRSHCPKLKFNDGLISEFSGKDAFIAASSFLAVVNQ